MTSEEIRKRFLDFFSAHEHTIVHSSSLIPENDHSVLLTTAGMQQFKPYYIQLKDPKIDFRSLNTVSIQKCARTSDIDEVGDERHLSFFEMLGNFSFGGYWKKKAIQYAYTFITRELNLSIDYVTVFSGDLMIPADEESKMIWKEIDSTIEIRNSGREDNFWGPTGTDGPCGPTTEIYVNGIEIWNIVFNQYFMNPDKELLDLKIKGIDTGMGLERLLMVVNKVKDVFETDLFSSIIQKIKELSIIENTYAKHIIADHIRTSVFLIADGVSPSNTDRGYILRRLIRRAVRYADLLSIPPEGLSSIAESVVQKYKTIYPNLFDQKNSIRDIINTEELKFRQTLEHGLKKFEKGEDPFILFTTYGFPIELTTELAKERGVNIDLDSFKNKLKEHQDKSRVTSKGMFKGGLSNHHQKTIELHTVHHLLLGALQAILGPSIHQRGSNITEERLRMDFSFDRKLTDNEKKEIEDWINKKIKQNLIVERKIMSKSEAEKLGAEMEFGAKYGDQVSVYLIKDKNGAVISKEFCGGPHISNTEILGMFHIQKEEAVSQGVRRIRGILN